MSSIKSAIIILLFAALVAGVYMYATGDLKFDPNEDKGPNNTGFMNTPEEFHKKLAELRIEQEKMERRKELMTEKKDKIVAFLKEKGVTSTSDISDADVKYKISNLKTHVNDIKVVDKSIDKYQEAINAVESMLAKLEQQRLSDEVNIPEEKAKELSIMLLDLDEKLSVDQDLLEEEALRELLGLELGE